MRRLLRRDVIVAIAIAAIPASLAQSEDDYTQTIGGVSVYLGIIPAEIVKGHPTLHGGIPTGPHEYHVVAAVFDAANSARITDATVTARVAAVGLAGPEKTLEPMNIANTITYGEFFRLPGADLYTIRVSVQRPGSQHPVVVEFKYDHRRR